jgi:hypothetical protein
MKVEAIQQLEQFKAQLNSSQTETVSISEAKPKRAINYPEHIKPLKERILSGLANGCRTPESVANYCGTTDIKLINLQLGRWVSRGIIGRHTNKQSGITRYYPHDIAKEKGFLTKPQPIIRKKKPKEIKNRSSFVMPKSLEKADRMIANDDLLLGRKQKYIELLENRVTEWQAEGRRQAHEIEDLKAKLAEVRRTRDVTSEVTEVMEEVTKLRATVAYLESKLFGGK